MRMHKLDLAIRTAASAMLLGALLAGCAKAPPAEPATSSPAAAPPPADVQPAPEAPPPTDPSPAPKPTSSTEPSVESMRPAIASAKMGVAVDLKYSFDGDVQTNQPVTLHLAAVPRVPGTELTVSVKQHEGLQVSDGAITVQKASASAVYRQQYSVTKLAASPAQIRVLVTMKVGEGSGFGYFSIPLEAGTNPQKQDPAKLR